MALRNADQVGFKYTSSNSEQTDRLFIYSENFWMYRIRTYYLIQKKILVRQL